MFGVSNKLRTKAQRAAAVPRFVAEVLPLFAAGRIEPLIDSVVDFARAAPTAKARMEAGAHVGKIVAAHAGVTAARRRAVRAERLRSGCPGGGRIG